MPFFESPPYPPSSHVKKLRRAQYHCAQPRDGLRRSSYEVKGDNGRDMLVVKRSITSTKREIPVAVLQRAENNRCRAIGGRIPRRYSTGGKFSTGTLVSSAFERFRSLSDSRRGACGWRGRGLRCSRARWGVAVVDSLGAIRESVSAA